MTFIPPGEKIVEKKICRISGQEFFVTDKDLRFYDKVSPIFNGNKYSIPTPTLCPDERQRRRMCFRNDIKIHSRKCDISGENIISCYERNTLFPVYHQKYWWGDSWSACSFGINFDNNKTFSEQYSYLQSRVPRPHGNIKNSINCDYCNYMIGSKNCYLAFASSWSEDVYYAIHSTRSKKVIDCSYCENLEQCYELIASTSSYGCFFSDQVQNCRDCFGCFDCRGCQNCIFCSNLHNASFHILNQPVSESEFLKKKEDFLHLLNAQAVREKYKEIHKKGIHKYMKGDGSINVLGDDLEHCQNCWFCFEMDHAENCKYCQISAHHNQKDCVDCTGSCGQWCYEDNLAFDSHMACFVDACPNSTNTLYSSICFSHDLFGCISLHSHEHHCILNTPYSVQEYETLCGKIIDHMRSTGEWGEFFPHELSPFGYNETVAQEYFPMTESEVRAKGWNWHTEEEKKFEGIPYAPLPISQYDERVVGFDTATKNINDCLAGMVRCEVTGRPFKIIKQELAFYIENGIPIPAKHPDQRHKERMELRNPRTLHERTCAECTKNIITTYAPERPEKVLCEECYRKLVY